MAVARLGIRGRQDSECSRCGALRSGVSAPLLPPHVRPLEHCKAAPEYKVYSFCCCLLWSPQYRQRSHLRASCTHASDFPASSWGSATPSACRRMAPGNAWGREQKWAPEAALILRAMRVVHVGGSTSARECPQTPGADQPEHCTESSTKRERQKAGARTPHPPSPILPSSTKAPRTRGGSSGGVWAQGRGVMQRYLRAEQALWTAQATLRMVYV